MGILIFYLINIIFNKFPILGYTLSSVIIAIIFAYIIDPIVNYLERKGVKRQFGVIIVYISAILIFGILIVSVIPKTINEISNLLTSLPAMVDTLIREVNNFASNVFAKFNIELPENFINVYKETNPKVNGDVETPQIVSDILNSIKATINDLIVKAQGSLMGSLSNVLSKLYGFLTSAFRLVLIIIFSFYFSVDKDRFMHRVKKAIPLYWSFPWLCAGSFICLYGLAYEGPMGFDFIRNSSMGREQYSRTKTHWRFNWTKPTCNFNFNNYWWWNLWCMGNGNFCSIDVNYLYTC